MSSVFVAHCWILGNAAVDAEIQRRELLRRPTTGAVIPLLKD